MRGLLRGDLAWMGGLDQVWFGVSVEDRRHGLPRIDSLREAPAQVRFLSIEPLLENLGEIDLDCIDWVIVAGGVVPERGRCAKNGRCRSAISA